MDIKNETEILWAVWYADSLAADEQRQNEEQEEGQIMHREENKMSI